MANSFQRSSRAYQDGAISDNIASAYRVDIADGRAPPSLEGTRYNRYGERAPGLGSLLDTKIVQRNIDREKDNLGEGFIELQITDTNKQTKPLNIGGRLHYADATGKFTIIDEKFLDVMKQRETEKREYIEGLIQTAIMSDEICATLLGVKNLDSVLGSGRGASYGIPAGDLLNVDAKPSAIETYSESSKMYSDAVQKFKMVLKRKMPIVSELTPDKAFNAN